MNISIVTIRGLKIEEMDVTSDALTQAKKIIEEKYKETGLEVEVKEITHPEKFSEYLFKERGYRVFRLQARGSGNPLLGEDEELVVKQLEKYGMLPRHLTQRGAPDFLVYNDNELFFVEAKFSNGLSINQLRWLARYPKAIVKILIVSTGENW